MPISSKKEETLLLNALEAYKSGQFKSIQSVAAHYGVSKWKLRNRKDGRTNGKGRTATRKVLNQLQERSLIRWIELLNSVYTPPTPLDIEGAANRILRYCGSDREVSKMMVTNSLHAYHHTLPSVRKYLLKKRHSKPNSTVN